ncbi:MAG TPA: GvpL/GvpF family gas vesicle protein [Vicinamibacterales bacterium]|nr:GvpL/GvpF family gas vesicle protein [Vicinamibacterales bacterium]
MAKAKKQPPARAGGARSRRAPARKPAVKRRSSRPQPAVPRSTRSGGDDDSRKAVQQPSAGRAAARQAPPQQVLTRVTHETEVRGTETRIERVVERTAKPSLPDVDRASAGRGRYVYCIIRANTALRFGAIGMDEQWPDVYTINYRDMAAIVSDVPIAPLDSTRENVLAHERVNETVMRDHTVIPMSFGTIFKTREDIVELLRSAYDAFADVLNKMQDKLEFGLKVLWDRDEIVRAIEQEDEDIHRLKREISSQKGSTYFARMQFGRLIDSALQQRSERYVTEFLQRLRDVSVASRVNRAIGDKMIMNAAFLVQRDQEQAFDRRIKEIASHFDKLTFKYTGPWPPYNFVNIRLKLERVGQH